MKKPLLLYILTLISLTLAAQKVDLDRFYFTATYIDLPRKALDPSYRTYSVRVETGRLARMDMHNDNLENEVLIDGWRKLDAGAHIMVNTRIDDVIIEKSDIIQREEIIKDKYGKQTGSRMHYSMQLVYSFEARLNVTDFKGAVILNQQLVSRENKRTYNCTEFDSRREAESFFRYNMVPVTSEIMNRSATGVLQDISVMLTVNYGFTQRTVNDFMWILNTRKNNESDDHKKAFLAIKDALFQMTADQPLDKTRSLAQPAIDYFENIKKRFSSSSKSDRKMRYASYYNLAKLYYYLDDPDAAMKQATGLELNDFDARDSKQLEAAATDLKWLLQQSGIRTRHFTILPDQLHGPEMNAASSQY